MKNIFFLICILFTACSGSKNSIYKVAEVDQLILNQELDDSEKEKIRLGINEHDNGNFEAAQSYYKSVLKSKPHSSLALYELVLTLNEIGKYKESIVYAKRGQEIENELRASFYHMQGVSLDYIGKPKEAIKVFKEGIEVEASFYFLHYSLAITSINEGDIDQGIESLQNALMTNFEHASSHFMLGNIYLSRNNRIPALLAYTYFLMYEPDSHRSQIAFEKIEEIFSSAKKDEATNEINIVLNLMGAQENEFSSVELLLSLHSAKRFTEENKSLSEIEHIVDGYELVLSTLMEVSDNENESDSFMKNNYLPYLFEVHENEYTETLVHLIFQTSLLENVSTWIDDNWEQCQIFYDWIPFEGEKKE